MTSRRDDDRGEPELLTSEDIFGDMLDDSGARPPASDTPPKASSPATRKSPIKVKLSDPGSPAAKNRTPLSTPGSGEALPDDVAALLDAFGDAEPSRPAAPAPTRPAPTPLDHAAVGMDALVEDLLSMGTPGPARPEAPPKPEPPAARTATKFQAAAPRATRVPEGAGVDLAGIAEEALWFDEPGPAPSVARDPERPAPEKPAGEAARETGDVTYGPYRLLERVAVGGMAEVFRAKRSGVEGFEKVVAVKRILSHLSDNKEFVDMFIDEAKMVAGLTHPNIVQIFDLGKIDHSYYIAMEYVHGRDLRTILRRAKERGVALSLHLSAYVASRMAAALEYAHRKRDEAGQPMLIVHRDVSPQNLLLSFEGDVKLTDFGIAKAASKATITDKGALRGKLLYMSPEQAWGRTMDRRSDIFSLGIVLYEMLTGQKPFLGNSETSILDTVRECRVPPPTTINDRIPEKLERVVMKALERDPEVRYQDAGEMHRDLERVLHEGASTTPRDVTLLLEKLFDESERGVAVSADWSDDGPSSVHDDARPAVGTPHAAAKDAPARDPLTIQKLLKRFGIK